MARPRNIDKQLAEVVESTQPAQPVNVYAESETRIITLTVPQDCTHTVEGLQAYLQELLDTAPRGVHVKIQIR